MLSRYPINKRTSPLLETLGMCTNDEKSKKKKKVNKKHGNNTNLT